jgi:glycosyltransferase involved in cell wall biosynthesis
MMTNTYRPFTGGVPRSVDTFAAQYRRMGHRVKIVAPTFEGQEEDPDVIRVPALQNFNGTDFSVQLPIPFYLSSVVDEFDPDVIHSHHPFLLGNAALRLAARREAPLIYTFHTFYEHYTHYLPGGDSEAMRRFVSTLVAGYAGLCDHVIAPSTSVREELQRRGVTKPVDVIPTGIDVGAIAAGDGAAFRVRHHIPKNAFVAGFVSRLAPEKNLGFLCDAVLRFLAHAPDAWFVVAGTGPSEEELKARLESDPSRDRIRMLGNQAGTDLAGLYGALDVFVFASQSETQGLVVTEAMAAGTPVVAVRASGVSDVVRDGRNGRLLEREDAGDFAGALEAMRTMDSRDREALRKNARATAESLSDEACARKALALYGAARREARAAHEHETAWDDFVKIVATEWNLLANLGKAAADAGSALLEPGDSGPGAEKPGTGSAARAGGIS